MSDLINRQDAIDALHNHFIDGFDEDRWWNSTHVLAVLKDVPSAEPVIRCKDCKHNYLDGIQVQFNRCELNHSKVHADDWFCANGERREQ